jgi:exodeoxyribonuclease VIII
MVVREAVMNGSTRVPFADYLKKEAVNFSTLKYMDKSPLHYQHALRFPREDSTSLLKGRAAHTAVFEPDEFGRVYAVYKGKIRRGKDWDAFKAVHPEDSILKLDEYNQALAIRDAVRNHPVAGMILLGGYAEQSIEWTDQLTGIRCKARLDWYNDIALADLKGTGSVDARWFGSLAARMKYHAQAAFYSDGLVAATGRRPPPKLIAVETNPPYDCAVFPLSDDDLFAGTETYQGWLKRVVECRESGVWPGRYPVEEPLCLPRYVFEDEDQEDGTSMVVEEEEAA